MALSMTAPANLSSSELRLGIKQAREQEEQGEYLCCQYLLRIDESRCYLTWGYASVRQFADVALGLTPRQVTERLRVARALGAWPALHKAMHERHAQVQRDSTDPSLVCGNRDALLGWRREQWVQQRWGVGELIDVACVDHAHIWVCMSDGSILRSENGGRSWQSCELPRIELWQERAGLGNSPRMILDELRQVPSADVLLPTTDGRELRVRCVVKPEPAQALLLERLGIKLPSRLRLDAAVPASQM